MEAWLWLRLTPTLGWVTHGCRGSRLVALDLKMLVVSKIFTGIQCTSHPLKAAVSPGAVMCLALVHVRAAGTFVSSEAVSWEPFGTLCLSLRPAGGCKWSGQPSQHLRSFQLAGSSKQMTASLPASTLPPPPYTQTRPLPPL